MSKKIRPKSQTAVLLRFPGYRVADEGGFWKDGKHYPDIDTLMEALPEHERCRLLDWNRRRFPEVIAKAFGSGAA
jgi:hypothetical protein